MGDKALFSRVCELYSEARLTSKLLQQAVDSRDFEKVQVLSLKLKGMSYIGAYSYNSLRAYGNCQRRKSGKTLKRYSLPSLMILILS